MLVNAADRRTVTFHKSATGEAIHSANFDISQPLPWRVEIDVVACDHCWPDETTTEAEMAVLNAAVATVQHGLKRANHAWAIDQIAKGARTVGTTELLALAKGKFASTRFDDLRKDGQFPEPVTASGRNVWIESEALDAIARVVAMDTEDAYRKKAPMNRFERRKASAKARQAK